MKKKRKPFDRRDYRQVGFTQLPHTVEDALIRARLNGEESRVLSAILRDIFGFQSKRPYPDKNMTNWSQGQIALMTGIHKSNVNRAISSLQAKNILHRVEAKGYPRFELYPPELWDAYLVEVFSESSQKIFFLDYQWGELREDERDQVLERMKEEVKVFGPPIKYFVCILEYPFEPAIDFPPRYAAPYHSTVNSYYTKFFTVSMDRTDEGYQVASIGVIEPDNLGLSNPITSKDIINKDGERQNKDDRGGAEAGHQREAAAPTPPEKEKPQGEDSSSSIVEDAVGLASSGNKSIPCPFCKVVWTMGDYKKTTRGGEILWQCRNPNCKGLVKVVPGPDGELEGYAWEEPERGYEDEESLIPF